MPRARRSRAAWISVVVALDSCVLSACNWIPYDTGLPPTATSGSLGYTLQTRRTSNEPREWTNQVFGSVTAASYIWQPWFITTSGTLRLTREQTTGGLNENGTTFATGEVTVAAFPQSTFPTTLSYSHSDSRVDGTLFSTNFTTDRAAFTNFLYLPNSWTVSTILSYSTTDYSDNGSDELKQAEVTVNKAFETQSVSATVRHDDSTFQTVNRTEETDRTDLVSVQHLYSPFEDANVQSNTTLLQQKGEFQDIDRNILSVQGVSTAQWRPRELPFIVNGALRTLTQSVGLRRRSIDAESDTDTTLFSGILGMNYPLARGLTANGGLTANYQDTKTATRGAGLGLPASSLTSESMGLLAGLNYYSEPQPLLGFDYSWNSSVNTLAQAGSDDLSGYSAFTALGHQGSRSVDLPLLGPAWFSISESGRIGYSTFSEGTYGLTHTAALTQEYGTATDRTYAQLLVTDNRDFGEFSSEYQLGTIQVSHNTLIDRDRSWQAGLALQAYRLVVDDLDTGWRTTLNGTGSYAERNFLDIDNLTFRSIVILNAVGLGSVVETRRERRIREELRSQWINRLEYRIGRLITSLEARIFKDNDRLGDLVRFQIIRYF